MIITLTNDFHNTEARLRVSDKVVSRGVIPITESQWRRAVRKLCGMADCSCGISRGGRYRLCHDAAYGHSWIEDRELDRY